MSKKARIIRYFVVFRLSIPGAWSSGDPNNFKYVEADSPKQALRDTWKAEKFGDKKHLDYEMSVYASADDYHDSEKRMKPLAERNKFGDGSISYR